MIHNVLSSASPLILSLIWRIAIFVTFLRCMYKSNSQAFRVCVQFQELRRIWRDKQKEWVGKWFYSTGAGMCFPSVALHNLSKIVYCELPGQMGSRLRCPTTLLLSQDWLLYSQNMYNRTLRHVFLQLETCSSLGLFHNTTLLFRHPKQSSGWRHSVCNIYDKCLGLTLFSAVEIFKGLITIAFPYFADTYTFFNTL